MNPRGKEKKKKIRNPMARGLLLGCLKPSISARENLQSPRSYRTPCARRKSFATNPKATMPFGAASPPSLTRRRPGSTEKRTPGCSPSRSRRRSTPPVRTGEQKPKQKIQAGKNVSNTRLEVWGVGLKHLRRSSSPLLSHYRSISKRSKQLS